MASFFRNTPEAPSDPNFGLAAAFKADPRPHKIDLVIGVYKNDLLRCELLPSVRRAKQNILEFETADYLPIEGNGSFCAEIGTLLLGELWDEVCDRIASIHTVGGTAALRVGGELMVQEVTRNLLLPHPTWTNHKGVFERVGCSLTEVRSYAQRAYDVCSVIKALQKAPTSSAVLLHAACFNPTGCDPTYEEWEQIGRIIRERSLLPFFDCAYQGFGEGLHQDAAAIRLFVKEGLQCVIAYSCSKNFSLYNQRVGALFVVHDDPAGKGRILSQLKKIVRVLYSNPPAHGAQVVELILTDPLLRSQWESEVGAMRTRIAQMRHLFVQKLQERGHDLSLLLKQRGMFSLLDLDAVQLRELRERYAIYMPAPGRINLAGLNAANLDAVVTGVGAVLR
jgi:aromatic-amino-acid transaminase